MLGSHRGHIHRRRASPENWIELLGSWVTPFLIVSDNGAGLTSNTILSWQENRKVGWQYIASGKPMQNCLVESFNGRMGGEYLNEQRLPSLSHACRLIETWRNCDNHHYPHSSLDGLTPPRSITNGQQRTKP